MIKLRWEIDTEFAFVTTYKACDELKATLDILGFKSIGIMNNWYPVHAKEIRPIEFWWTRIHEGPNVKAQVPAPHHYGYGAEGVHGGHLQSGGCGFQFTAPPLKYKVFWRFFTALRMPLKPSGISLWWLERHNFRKFDTGTFATFWVNGWESKAYDYTTIEIPYWEKHGVSLDAKIEVKKRPVRAPKVVGQ
jgi:hypothetical protein